MTKENQCSPSRLAPSINGTIALNYTTVLRSFSYFFNQPFFVNVIVVLQRLPSFVFLFLVPLALVHILILFFLLFMCLNEICLTFSTFFPSLPHALLPSLIHNYISLVPFLSHSSLSYYVSSFSFSLSQSVSLSLFLAHGMFLCVCVHVFFSLFPPLLNTLNYTHTYVRTHTSAVTRQT